MNRRTIVGGPSKFDLLLSLSEGKEVSFTLERAGRQLVASVRKVVLTSLAAEDGSREKWMLGGVLVGGNPYFSTDKSLTFSAFYDGRRRTGWMETHPE